MSDKLLRSRPLKNTKRPYFCDKVMRKTNFEIGSHYKTVIDLENKKLILIPSDDEADNTVCKRAHSDGLTPLIDIRDKSKLKIFEDSDHLVLNIFEDQIVIEGYQEVKDGESSGSCGRVDEVINITSKIKAKKQATMTISVDQLKMASGLGGTLPVDAIESIFESTLRKSSNVVNMESALENLKVSMDILDLFSGAGLLSKAFKDAGFNIVKAYEGEIDCEGAIETYEHNVGKHIEKRDILTLEIDELPEVDGLIAGIPCDKLTTINTRTNIRQELDEGKKLIDCEAFSLFKKTCDAIKSKVKSWFFLEEVTDIYTVADGGLIKAIEDYLPDFTLNKFVVEASDYGVAQSRKRAFIVGSKIGEFEEPEKTHIDRKVTVGEALTELDDSIPNQKDYSKARALTIEKMSHIPQGGNWRDVPPEIRTGRFHNYLRRLDENKVSCTLANIRKNLITNPWENRILSVRECARLMGLNDDFVFYGKLSSKQQQVCQGVAYQPAIAFATAIREMIERYNSKYELRSASC